VKGVSDVTKLHHSNTHVLILNTYRGFVSFPQKGGHFPLDSALPFCWSIHVTQRPTDRSFARLTYRPLPQKIFTLKIATNFFAETQRHFQHKTESRFDDPSTQRSLAVLTASKHYWQTDTCLPDALLLYFIYGHFSPVTIHHISLFVVEALQIQTAASLQLHASTFRVQIKSWKQRYIFPPEEGLIRHTERQRSLYRDATIEER
jgi:hypothetical protein